jgi:hypothetical protein
MDDDNHAEKSYSGYMQSGSPYIVLKLDTTEPIELGDFVSAFTSVASQYDQFMRAHHPDLAPDATVFVKEVRVGCIEADLIPWAALSGLPAMVGVMDQMLIVEEFVKLYGRRLGAYFTPGGRDETATPSDLKDFMGQIASIAKDPDASATISSVSFKDGERKITASVTFDTKQAQSATQEIVHHRLQLDHKDGNVYERVLMMFSQSNKKIAEIGKRTGERVVIPSISDRDIAIFYASELAEQRIKHEILHGDANVYKKGFVVDVRAEMRNGKVIAYRISNVHEVIDLPDDGGE